MTISVYPTITARVLPLNDIVPVEFFIPVCCFLNFNLFGRFFNCCRLKDRCHVPYLENAFFKPPKISLSHSLKTSL